MMLSKVVEYMIGRKKPEETAIPSRSAGKPADRSPAGWRDTIRLAGGIPMARCLNPVGFRWLKSNYLSTAALLATWPRRFSDRDFDLFFTALTVQANPGMSDDDALAAVRRTRRTRIYLALLLRGGLGHDFEESAR